MNGLISMWQQQVDRFLGPNNEAIYIQLVGATGGGPFDGGCVLFAQALKERLGGSICVLTSAFGAEHAILKVGDVLIDASGPGSIAEMIARWNSEELRNVTGCRQMVDGDLPDAARNDLVARNIAGLLPLNLLPALNTVFKGKLATKEITGQLIQDSARRQEWFELVIALQVASEMAGGPLKGWVFHGTDGEASLGIEEEGILESIAYVPTTNGEWEESKGVHFGTANVAAFFAEDRIESKEDPDIDMIIYGASLAALKNCGDLAVDGQMLDQPLSSRTRVSEKEVFTTWEASAKDWKASLDVLETVVVLGVIPRELLTGFRSARDVHAFCERVDNVVTNPVNAERDPIEQTFRKPRM